MILLKMGHTKLIRLWDDENHSLPWTFKKYVRNLLLYSQILF